MNDQELKTIILALMHQPLLDHYRRQELRLRGHARFAKRRQLDTQNSYKAKILDIPRAEAYQMNGKHFELLRNYIKKNATSTLKKLVTIPHDEYVIRAEEITQDILTSWLKKSDTSNRKINKYLDQLDHEQLDVAETQKLKDNLLQWLNRQGKYEIRVSQKIYQKISTHTQQPIQTLQDLWKQAYASSLTHPKAFIRMAVEKKALTVAQKIWKDQKKVEQESQFQNHIQEIAFTTPNTVSKNYAQDHYEWFLMTKEYVLPTESLAWLRSTPQILADHLEKLEKKSAKFALYQAWCDYLATSRESIYWKAHDFGSYLQLKKINLADFRSYYAPKTKIHPTSINRAVQRFRSYWNQLLFSEIKKLTHEQTQFAQVRTLLYQQLLDMNEIQDTLLNQLENDQEFYSLCYFTQSCRTWCDTHHNDRVCFQDFTQLDDTSLKAYLFCHHLIEMSL